MMTISNPDGSRRWFLLVGALLVVGVFLLLVILGTSRQKRVRHELQERQDAVKAGPAIPVVTAGRGPVERTVTLSGEARPYATVTMYAKVSGYLREIRVDKGDRAGRGQVLAMIEAPELDRQYDAAVADAANRRIFADREKELLKEGVVSQQDYDSAEAAARVAEATAQSLKSQKGYEVIKAPCSGTITARFVDPGALLQSATTAQTSAQPVVTISQTDRLRVYVYLDQRNASLVKVGDPAIVADAARPDVQLKARVSRMSGELDPKTRTLLVELDLDNRDGRILAGGFVQVSLTMRGPAYVQVPADALLSRGEKAFVAVVRADNRVEFRSVTPADSDGRMVRLAAGLAEGERVALNPGTGIVEGEVVRPVVQDTR